MSRLLLYLMVFLISGCYTSKSALQPTYNKGGFILNKYNSKALAKADSIVIVGKIAALNKNEMLVAPTIMYGCISQKSETGDFLIKTKAADIKLQLSATAVGYLTVETEPIISQKGDSIVVNFYLTPDERPLLNCEGNIK